ncbi:MAG TPA: GIY-YIG nuclease family protein [Mycobacteriales bacterium]|nr:GIY-YIG nuclease family protein [Mycobacteriales bacterium]
MAATREHILREIRRLAAENGGKSLGVKRFQAETGIGQNEWLGRYWVRWSDAVREAGLEPGEWNERTHSDDDLLRVLAMLTRENGRIPTVAELRMRKRADSDMPGADLFRRRLGEKSVLRERLLAFADADPELADVAAICAAQPGDPGKPGWRRKPDEPHPRVVTGVVYLLRMGEFYKIGKSNDPGRRLYEVGLRLPEKHDLVHVIETDDPSGIEAYWHRRFASQRANGEWFRLATDDVSAFRRRESM